MFGGSIYDELKVPRGKMIRDGIIFFLVAATLFECGASALIIPLVPKGQLPYPWNVILGVALLTFILVGGIGGGIWHARYRRRRVEGFLADVQARAARMRSEPLPDGVIWSGKADVFQLEHRDITVRRNDRRYTAMSAKNILLGVPQVKGHDATISYYVRLDTGMVEVTSAGIKLANYKELPHSMLLQVSSVGEGEKIMLEYEGGEAFYVQPKQRGLKPQEDGDVFAAAMVAAANLTRVDALDGASMIDPTQEVL
jgi:hypothetical protein